MLRARLDGVLLVIGVLVIWESVSRRGLISPLLLPPFIDVLTTLLQSLVQGDLLYEIGVTLRVFVQGLALASLVGIGLGLLMGLYTTARGMLGLAVELLRPMPSVAIIPLAIILFGLDDAMKRFVVGYAALWPILLNTLYGVAAVEPQLLQVARTFHLGQPTTIWNIILPAALPSIATGLRVSAGVALILTITTELIGSRDGLGYFVLDAQLSFQTPRMFAGIVAIAVVGCVLNVFFRALETRAVLWSAGRRNSR
jgi:NitT/TauT family transport system permease protein